MDTKFGPSLWDSFKPNSFFSERTSELQIFFFFWSRNAPYSYIPCVAHFLATVVFLFPYPLTYITVLIRLYVFYLFINYLRQYKKAKIVSSIYIVYGICQVLSKSFTEYLIIRITLWGKIISISTFTKEETKAKRSKVTCLRLNSK